MIFNISRKIGGMAVHWTDHWWARDALFMDFWRCIKLRLIVFILCTIFLVINLTFLNQFLYLGHFLIFCSCLCHLAGVYNSHIHDVSTISTDPPYLAFFIMSSISERFFHSFLLAFRQIWCRVYFSFMFCVIYIV